MNLSYHKTAIFNFIVAMVMPVFGVVASVLFIINRRIPSWIAFAMSVSLIYSYMPILWDVRNNFFLVHLFRENIGLNFYVRVIDLLESYIGLQYIFVLFLFGVLIIYIFGRVIGEGIFEHHRSDKVYFFIGMVMLFMTLEYRSIFDLQKTTLALAFFLLAVNCENKIYQYALSMLAILVHPLVLLIVILFWFAKVGRRFSLQIWGGVILVGLILAVVLTPDNLTTLGLASGAVPEKIAYYFTNKESRFSTKAVSNIVWVLRIFACLTITVACIIQMKNSKNDRESRLLRFLAYLAIATISLSRNDVFVERYFIALVIFSAYVISKIRFRKNLAAFIMIPIMANVLLHGIYTIMLVHGESYKIIMTSYERKDMSLRGGYYPTVLLLDYARIGYSDDLIMSRASIASN
jgi:hypothetical protein